MNANDLKVEQLLLCAEACYQIPSEVRHHLSHKWKKNPVPTIQKWWNQFSSDLYEAKYGYCTTKPQDLPYTEIFIEKILSNEGVLNHCDILQTSPAICVSHDIDHLCSSLKLTLKRFISEHKLSFYNSDKNGFLQSIEALLKATAPLSASSNEGVATVFVSTPIWSKNPIFWPAQWIMDPSYNVDHSLFQEFLDILKTYKCKIGLHGSFYSISQNYLHREREELENVIGENVNLIRQHWLHLPGANSLKTIKKSQFTIDSSLGWNGSVGFRGGMVRPFEILIDLKLNTKLWEVPLLLMDGPLFNDMKIPKSEIFSFCKVMLKRVRERNGCVSINWHDRSAHPSYNWFYLFEEILEYCQSEDFKFLNFDQAVSVQCEAKSTRTIRI